MSVELLIRNAASTIGEGPHWDDVTQTLLYVDLLTGDLNRWQYDSGHVDKTNIGTMPADGMTFGEQRLYSCENGVVRSHKDGISLSNGIAWSLDHTTMYYVDTIPRSIYAFDYDVNAGNVSNERVIVDFGTIGPPDIVGYPDGMAMDTGGKLWVACFGGGRVVRLDPETGKFVQTVDLPVQRVASCCFGGPNLDELFVTTAKFKYTAKEPDEELAGSVFRVKGLGVKGLRASKYQGNSAKL